MGYQPHGAATHGGARLHAAPQQQLLLGERALLTQEFYSRSSCDDAKQKRRYGVAR